MQVMLYGKKDCCLCEDAKFILNEISRIYPLVITEIDIYTDEVLIEKYGIMIPVIVIEGEEVASGLIHKDVIINFVKNAYTY
ncbi:MAG: glutaredoxin family protein [Bacillaceae bacterium]